MVKLAELIKTALNDVGCEELPSGCDDISVDPSFIESNISNNDQQPVSSINLPAFCVTFENRLVTEIVWALITKYNHYYIL